MRKKMAKQKTPQLSLYVGTPRLYRLQLIRRDALDERHHAEEHYTQATEHVVGAWQPCPPSPWKQSWSRWLWRT